MGLLFGFAWAFILGKVICWPLGLGRMGTGWHLGIGVAGIASSWLFMIFLPLPHLVRITINGFPLYLVWSAVGTIMVGAVVALAQPEG